MTDLLSLKQDFCNIVQKAQPWILSHFVMWLDLKVSEYKVYGYMILEQGTNLLVETKEISSSRESLPSVVHTDNVDTQYPSHRPPCLVVPRPNLSADREPTSSSTSINASTTPIFKRPLHSGRVNRRKQLHVFKRSSESLLSALSDDIQSSSTLARGEEWRDEQENRSAAQNVCRSNDERDDGQSEVSKVSMVTTKSHSNEETKSESESKEEDREILPESNVVHIDINSTSHMLRDSFDDSDCIEKKCSRSPSSSVNCEPVTDKDTEVMSSQYAYGMSRDEFDDIDSGNNDPVQEGILVTSQPSSSQNTSSKIGFGTSSSRNGQEVNCDTFCSSSDNLSSTTSSPIQLNEASPSQLSIKQERSGLEAFNIKQEPVESENAYKGNATSVSNHGNSLLQQHLAYPNNPAYFDGVDWKAIGFNQYLDNSQGFNNSFGGNYPEVRRRRRVTDMTTSNSPANPALTCNLCGAVFRFKSSLSRHKTLHGEKRFHCFVCPKAFHRREHLLLHLQRHANSAMITCPVCHMQASSVKHLEEHYRLNHGPFKRTGVMPYLAHDNSR